MKLLGTVMKQCSPNVVSENWASAAAFAGRVLVVSILLAMDPREGFVGLMPIPLWREI
ncbi:hypothetical protein ciss_12910 [Carboxydothermus islandicus]|uniref:Uncharacterized protein n=1 Tax=Carboxydothermus islandicus TaxID=661089 RepID=A0A1L8D2F1_9THEO|nr:hypothetical protein ciss_12910 [Carboxydothermus islandicus]